MWFQKPLVPPDSVAGGGDNQSKKKNVDLERYLETKESIKESGRVDLKARRKDHIFPMKGKPKSPGGRAYLVLPSGFS